MGGINGKYGGEEKCTKRFGEETRRKYTNFKMRIRLEDIITVYLEESGFGGLGVACWPLVPKFVGFKPGRSRRIF